MRPDEFNYDRYLRACEDMDARAEGFHRGEFLPVMQWSLGPNTYSFDCRDPKRMLENQLDGITQTLAASNDQPRIWSPGTASASLPRLTAARLNGAKPTRRGPARS